MIDIKGQLGPKDSLTAIWVVYLPQIIAAIGVFLAGIAAVIAVIK